MKLDLLSLVRKERDARLSGNVLEQEAAAMQTRAVIVAIRAQQAKMRQNKIDAETAKVVAKKAAELKSIMNGRIIRAEVDLAESVNKLNRLSKAKDMLMARAGEAMTLGEEKDFARSIASFIALVEQVKLEVNKKQVAVNLLKA